MGFSWGVFPFPLYLDLLVMVPFFLISVVLLPRIITGVRAFRYREGISEFDGNLFILMICGLAILCPIGTNTGIKKIFYFLPLLLPVFEFGILESFALPRKCSYFILGALVLCGIFMTPLASYCEANKLECRYPFHSESLRFLQSSRERRQMLDRLISELKKRTTPKEEILNVFSLKCTPLVVAGLRSWNPDMGSTDATTEKKFFDYYKKTKPLPRIALVDEESFFYKEYGNKVLQNYEKCFSATATGQHHVDCFSIWKLKPAQ